MDISIGHIGYYAFKSTRGTDYPCIYEDVITSFSEAGLCAMKRDGKCGLCDKEWDAVYNL